MPATQLRLFTEEPDRQEFQSLHGEQPPRLETECPEPRQSQGLVSDPFAGRELIVGELVCESPGAIQEGSAAEIGPLPRIVNSHVVLWVVLLSFGPLGLPLFWMSPRYRLWSKLLITAMTLGVTIVFPIALTLYFADFALQPLLNAVQDANQAGGAY